MTLKKSTSASLSQTSMTSLARAASKYSANDPHQTEITKAVALFIAGDLMPLSVVESPHFRRLMNIIDSRYQVPSRKHLTTQLLPQISDVKEKLKNCLDEIQSLRLAVDLWSNRQMKGFMGSTGHFLSLTGS